MANVLHSQASGIHPGAYHQAAAPSSPADGILWVDMSTAAPYVLKVWNATAGAWQAVGGIGGGGSLSAAIVNASGNVALTPAGTYRDIVSIILAAGTWILWASAQIQSGGGGGGDCTAKVWDGTTAYASAELSVSAPNLNAFLTLPPAQVVLSGSTTLKLSCVGNTTNLTVRAAAPISGAGNTATGLFALRVA